MGNITKSFEHTNKSTYTCSNNDNDYNPFNIPSIELNNPEDFTKDIAIKGCPPFHEYTKAQFAKLSIVEQASYADGVVRGSYQKDWVLEQLKNFYPNDPNINMSSIGALAYLYLKTKDETILENLIKWNNINFYNNELFY